MKRIIQFWFTAILLLHLANTSSFAQLSAGDIAFVGYNADGNDGFAFIALNKIPAGTVIHFQDNEWNGLAIGSGGAFNAGEGSTTWTNGVIDITPGTVVELLNASVSGSRTVNFGTLSGGTLALGNSGESIFAFVGTNETTPTIFLAAITNNNGGFSGATTSGLLTNTGLTAGSTALVLPGTGGADVAAYNPTTGGSLFASKSAALSAFNNPSNWVAQDASGSQDADDISPDAPFLTDTQSPIAGVTFAIGVNLSVSANAGTETGVTVITVTATAAAAVSGAQTVDVAVTGTGITAGDYTLSNTSITIPNGMTTGTVTFTIVNDTDVEGTETATLTISNPSSGISLGATTTKDITITDNDAAPSTTIDLSTYVRIGRYNLPVPLRATAPTGNQLALEVSAITYNPVNGNLYVLGDEGTSIVEVDKNGQLISTMTLTAGDFADPEGLTHFSGSQFVLVEERERQANLFTYVAGGTLSRANVQSVKLGTTIGNIGLEGISYDSQTGGYILVKEITPQGIFQTGIDFGAGTATNGSPSTVNSTNLFDPALAGLIDIGDVYALSNLPTPLTDDNLLVLSQEDGKVINIDRTGIIANSLTITTDPGNPLNVAGQGHEGVAMDNAGLLYIVNEQGGGDVNHPQLWVYAPATYVYTNAAPVEVSVANPPASLPENTSTASRVKVGNIIVSDDALGTNALSLTGADAAAFEIDGNELFLKAGTVLDFETKPSYSVTINVNDASVGGSPDAIRVFTLVISDVFDNPSPLCITEVAPWSNGNSPGVGADWFEVTNTSGAAVDITGWKIDDDSGSFALASALSGVTSIAAGQSVIFVDGDATKITAFINVWFGGTLPSGVLVGNYGGPGLGAGGDAVNLFDASGTLITGVTFGVSPSASPFATFNNAACNANVSALSIVGTNGAFSVVDGANTLIGSPGSITCTAPTATISGGGNVCNPATTTTVTISGTPNAVVVLSNSTMVTIEGDGSTDISLGAGTYTIASVTSAAPASCAGTGSGSVTVTVNPIPTPSIIVTENSGTNPNDGIICEGASVTLATSGGGNYAWSAGPTPTAPSITVSPNITTTYTVTVTNNGCDGTASSVITVNSKPTVTDPADQTVCDGESIPTLVLGAVASTYDWTNNTTSIGLGAGGNGNVPAFVANNDGNTPVVATITVTETENGCTSDPVTYTITVNPKVEPTFTQLGPYCQDATPGNLPGTSLNGISGTWSPASISTAADGSTRYVFTPNVGTCADTASMRIFVDTIPDAPILQDITVCEGGSTDIMIQATGGAGTPEAITFTYNFEGEVTTGIKGGAGSANGTVTNATRGPGVAAPTSGGFPAGSGSTDAYSSDNWTTSLSMVDVNDYFQFCVSANSGYLLDLTQIAFDVQRSGSGPASYQIAVSTNGTAGPFVNVGAAGSNPTTFGNRTQTLAVTDAANVCIRVYAYGSTGATGTLRIDNVVITGSVKPQSTTNCRFYAVNPATNPSAVPVAQGTSYDPGTTAGTSPDTIWVTCVGANGCASPATRVIVKVNPIPTLNIVQPQPACSPETVDVTAVDLGASPVKGTVSYHNTNMDAENDVNPISSGLNAVASTRTVYVRYEVADCYIVGQINVMVSTGSSLVLPDSLVVCNGQSTNIQAAGTAAENTFTWDFEAGITGPGVSQNPAIASNAAVQSTGSGITASAQGAGSGCSNAITSTSYETGNTSLADAVADNEFFEFCVGAPQAGYTFQGVNSIVWANRASGTGPIYCALVAADNLATPILTDTLMAGGTDCEIEGGNITLNPATCYRIYYWGGTATAGTLRIENVDVKASYAANVACKFYAVDPVLNPGAVPVATGANYDPGTTLASSPDTVWVTCTNLTTGCVTPAERVIVKVLDCSVSIADPCTCTGPIEQIENGTYTNNGKFSETVTVNAPAGQTWTVASVTKLYEDASGTDLVDVGDALTETSPGVYKLNGYHIDSIGYSISVTNSRGVTLSISNKCYYPDPRFSGIPAVVTTSKPSFTVTGIAANSAAGTGTFYLNNTTIGTGPAPTQVSIDPANLPVGENTLVFKFDAGVAGGNSLLNPSCAKEVRQKFIVYEDKCSCMAVNVSLDANCQFKLLPSIISPNCVTGTVRVMDNDPSNGDTIDCAGVWTYALFDLEGKIICWGQVTAEDKTPPKFVCADWYKGTLDCYDVDFVLNNRLTIGNVNATASPRPAPTSSQTINNAEGVNARGKVVDTCAVLVPPALVADNINNLGYTYFKDNCYNCGCRTNVKWSDRVVYYNCDQMKVNGGIYARIYRTWVATDCKGMSRDTVQEIPFARPSIDDFGYNGQGDGGKYDYVAELSSCVPDKELIQKSDYMPFVCSYFNRTVAPRNSRCLYLDEVECNYSVSFKDTEFPICGGKGLKIDRELYVFDWCAGGIVDTFHILIKIGDFQAPNLEYAQKAPFDISTGPMDCTAAFPISVAGIKAQFGVTVKDNCNLGNISVKVKTKDRYVKGILVAENTWDQVEYAVMNGMMVGLPVGQHRLIIDAFDGCYNAVKDSFLFKVVDKIAPVMKCDDDLHVTLSNANGYTNGYAQVRAEDIDEGSWDNCKLAWIAVRRNVPTSCVASFIAKGYDTNNNGKLDPAVGKDLNSDGDYNDEGESLEDGADGFDRNGDGDLADFGETFILKGGKLMTPLQDIVEFFCCDLTERVTVELWGGDIYGNTNYCWMDVLIEDKVAPTCLAPWAVTVYCDDKGLAQIDDKAASAKIFGDITIPSGNDCAALDTAYSTVKKLKCGAGYIDRIWTLTKQTVKGPISVTCTQRIHILPVHEYNICFPKDVSTDCKTPIIDTVITDELGCDILAVNVHDKRYDASDDECYKIFRTYSVINWCTYDDRCGDPLLQTNISVIRRDYFDNYGKAPIYLLVRDSDRDQDEEFFISENLTPNERTDFHILGDPDRNGSTTGNGYNSEASGTVPYCSVAGEYYHSFIYTQIIKVYDETRPVVTGDPGKFCIREGGDCLANLKMVITGKDECSDKVTLETQFLMIAPGQTLNAGSMIMYSTPRWSTKDLGNGQFEINVANLPEGKHDLIIVVRDECGNLSVPTRIPFTVEDCKGPAPICINGLSTELMPDGAGGGMMAVWASDFVASKIYDCNGQGPETKDGLKLVTKYSINRVGQPVVSTQTGINLTCADRGKVVLVELHAWDNAGKDDFCVTYIEVQDNRSVCPGSVTEGVTIAGTISTEGVGNLQGVSVTLSGSGTQNDMTGTDGNYEFVNISKGGDFTVTPQLDKNHLNGVSTFDLVLIQKHILGVQALNSPYKMIAADANNSKSISTLDMIQIRKLVLNIDTHFANNTSWRFVDATYRFPNATNPWSASFPEVVSVNDLVGNIKANFVAIKIGDVNASASVNNAASAEIRTNGQFKLNTLEQNLKSGNEYQIAFSAEDLQNIQGYQFALNLDQSKVELVDIEYGVAKAENFGIFKNEGLVTTSWNSKYEPGALFTLVLRAKADAKLSSVLSLNRVLSPEAYNQNNENLGIALNFEGIQASEAYELRQNTPNPFSAETLIGFTLPKATKGTLTVRDVKGALIYKVEGNYTKGNNQVILKKEQLGASGVLYYTLETSDFTATKKMVILQ